MKIQILNLEGIHVREIKGLAAVEKKFPKDWLAYASLELLHEAKGSREFDLIIVTYDRILAIEIKDWNGELKSNGREWFVNKKSRGKSPVLTISKKAKILHGNLKKISHKIKNVHQIPVIGLVVLTGSSGKQFLSYDEKKYVFTLEDFLKLSNNIFYSKCFGSTNKFHGLCNNRQPFDQFFLNKRLFKPQEEIYQNHKIFGDPIFVHPNNLYQEFQALDISLNTKALLRLWNLGRETLSIEHQTQEARREIVEREARVLAHLKHVKPDLFEDRIIIEQKYYQNKSIITDKYAELYDLPINQERLSLFLNKTPLSSEERVNLIKFMLSYFAEIHEANIAHRDLGQDCIWANPSKISFSGFMCATLPNAKTIRERLPILSSKRLRLPEHVLDDLDFDPFRQDIFLLGVASHLIAFSEFPADIDGVPDWSEKESFQIYNSWFEKCLSWDPLDRYSNAREMLDSFNELSEDNAEYLDLSSLIEGYYSAGVVYEKYPLHQKIKNPPPAFIYKSEKDGIPVIVKVWSIGDITNLSKNIDLLNFFQVLDRLINIKCNSISKIVEFGIDSMNNIFQIQQFYEGLLVNQLETSLNIEIRAEISIKLIEAVNILHENEIYHRDIRPENVLVTFESGHANPILIDVVEYGQRDYCQNYVPSDYKQISLKERDVYAVAVLILDLLGIQYKIVNGRVNVSDCESLLKNVCSTIKEMTLPNKKDRLPVFGHLLSELQNIVCPTQTEQPLEIEIFLTNSELSSEISIDRVYCLDKFVSMVSENGVYYIRYKSQKGPKNDEIFITGMNQEIKIRYNRNLQRIEKCWVNYVDFEQVMYVSNNYSSFSASIKIQLSSTFNVTDLNQFLIEKVLPSINKEDITDDLKKGEFDKYDYIPTDYQKLREETPTTAERWEALIDVEENMILELNVTGNPFYREEDNLLLIPYELKNYSFDYNENDEVKVLYKNKSGESRLLGKLNLNRTNNEILYIETQNLPVYLDNIRVLFLESLWENSSFLRRSNAVKRIASRKSAVSNLLDFFDGKTDDIVSQSDIIIDDKIIDIYFGDNKTQKDTFNKILTNRPVGLLQGPPGTGKTRFIAAFVHYIFNYLQIRNVLLVSQSHVAVNNLAEAIIKMYTEIDADSNINMVRIGSEGVISKPLLKYHSAGLKDKYKNIFKADFKRKIVSVAKEMGLPNGFASLFFDISQSLGEIVLHIRRLKSLEDKNLPRDIKQRINSLTDTFYNIYNNKYKHRFGEADDNAEIALADLEKRLKEKYNVSSYPYYLTRLEKLISLGEDWMKILDTNTRNFEEFLARTRSIIVGTCVGVGKPSLKIEQNVYDWVIIDEAARCNPGELAVSMQVGKNILLVGDHKQLPPMMDENVISAAVKKMKIDETYLKISEFQRLMENRFGKMFGCSLDTQYRMCEPIAEMISDIFYKDDGIKLKTAREGNPEFYNHTPEIISKPVTWIDTTNGGDSAYHKSDAAHSLYNIYEADFIIRILDLMFDSELFIDCFIESVDEDPPIGIITPYAAQKMFIQKEIEKRAWPSKFNNLLKIDTIDSYQGKENQIVIVSLTRNDKKLTTGFLKFNERINVCLSRARERLVIIGATRMWEDRPPDMPLRKILEYILNRKDTSGYGLINADQYINDSED